MLTEHVGARIQGVWHDQDVAGRDAIYQRRWGVAPSVTIGLGTPTRLTASYYYLESHELPDSGIPYLYTLGNAPEGVTMKAPALGDITTNAGETGNVSRDTFYGLADRDFRDTRKHKTKLRGETDCCNGNIPNTARLNTRHQAPRVS